jgi:hypothetical protein
VIAKSQPIEKHSREKVLSLNALLLAKRRSGVCLHYTWAYSEVFSQTVGEQAAIGFALAVTGYDPI